MLSKAEGELEKNTAETACKPGSLLTDRERKCPHVYHTRVKPLLIVIGYRGVEATLLENWGD